MNQCIQCIHWLPKRTATSMARLGFAQCELKDTGHCMSAKASACEKFGMAAAGAIKAREVYLKKVGVK